MIKSLRSWVVLRGCPRAKKCCDLATRGDQNLVSGGPNQVATLPQVHQKQQSRIESWPKYKFIFISFFNYCRYTHSDVITYLIFIPKTFSRETQRRTQIPNPKFRFVLSPRCWRERGPKRGPAESQWSAAPKGAAKSLFEGVPWTLEGGASNNGVFPKYIYIYSIYMWEEGD